ncbi:hypothetical protein Tdes44962_MAKER00738 [Teratosphaeria destructans]|uniref:DUF7587 domain-containing protein n=1 Tax=Teratosphaeria destructans TaxID=418781 RepID=A0A9W7W055_9PEZI|nr:hypothetical protein Tdes44962_MAKER00738 [Teratosphaeria destructans]
MGSNKRNTTAQPRKTARPRAQAKVINKWNELQRTTVHILHDKFPGLEARTRSAVFNLCFRQHLTGRGLPDGLPATALSSQYSEHKTKPGVWGKIIAEPQTNAEFSRRRQLISKIKLRAAAVTSKRLATFNLGDITDDEEDNTLNLGEDNAVLQFPITPTSRQSSAGPRYDEPVTPGLLRRSGLRRAPGTSRDKDPSSTPRPPIVAPVEVGSDVSDFEDEPIPSQSPRRRKKISSPGRANGAYSGKVKIHRRSGPPLYLSHEKFQEMKLDPVPVSGALAHPPQSGLLYRYWDSNSQGINSETEFVAGFYDESNAGLYNSKWNDPAPACDKLSWSMVENHIDRKKKHSHFISASNCFIWILRLAAKERKKGAQRGKITLISTDSIDPRSIYHVNPYWRQLKKQRCFTNGAWHYGGVHEFLIWREIKADHIVNTFEVDALFDLVEQKLPSLGAILRLEILHERRDLKKNILARLESGQNELTAQNVMAIARLCRFMGLATEGTRYLQHVLSDVIQGWRLKVQPLTNSQWDDLSVYWVHGLCARTVPSFQRQQELRMCFLFAVKEGLGDFNMLHTPKTVRSMQDRGRFVGLESPAKIWEESLRSATDIVHGYEREERARVTNALERLLPGIKRSARVASNLVALDEEMQSVDDEDSVDEDCVGDEIMFDADDEDEDSRGL